MKIAKRSNQKTLGRDVAYNRLLAALVHGDPYSTLPITVSDFTDDFKVKYFEAMGKLCEMVEIRLAKQKSARIQKRNLAQPTNCSN